MLTSAAGTPIAWKPLPVQELALTCPAREVLYAGSKGSGKSDWLAASWLPILKLAQEKFERTRQPQRKCRIVLFRKNLEHLKDLIAKTHYIYPMFDPAMGSRGYHTNEKIWTFTSGATVAFRHLDGPTDHLGYHGNELVGVGFDQLEQIPKEVYTFIIANLRSGDPDYHAARKVRATANPGGYDWIIPYFGIDQNPEGGKILRIQARNDDGTVHESTRAFILAKIKDNPHLPPDYEAQLRAIYNEDELDMYVNANFFRVAGAYFSTLFRPSLHLKKSHPIPSSWEFRFAMDWGSTNPACWLLGARDNDGRLWVIDELHGPGVTGRRFGETLTKKFQAQKWCAEKTFRVDDFYGVIDKQAMDRYGSDASAADGISDWGFRLFPAQKDRESGCNAMKERLLLDRHGNPQVIVFEDRCPNLVRALSAIQSQAPKNPDDYEDGSPHSHAVDAFRFLCMEFPVRPSADVNPKDAQMQAWERYVQRAKAMQRQREGDSYISGGYE
ncbi:MAG TPA: terminase family protein [Salinarimonas sp.]|nr:terminase family protein [Salinarimonas sp.]